MPNSGFENLTLASGSARMNLALPHTPRKGDNLERRTPNAPPFSKIVLVDVVFGEDMRRAEKYLAAVDDLEFPEPAGIEFRIARFEFAVDHCAHGVGRGVAEINWIPENICLYGSVLKEGLHLVGGRHPDDRNFANEASLGDGIGSTREGNARQPDNAFDIGVSFEDLTRYFESQLLVFLCRQDCD